MRLQGQLSLRVAAVRVAIVAAMVERAEANTTGGPNTIDIIGQVTHETGGYRYSYTIDYSQVVSPNGPSIPGDPVIGLTLPFFDDISSISDIHSPNSPDQWSHEFVTATTTNWPYSAPGFPTPSFVLHWFVDATQPTAQFNIPGVQPGEVLGGFDFLSPYPPGEGPVLVTLGAQPGTVGDTTSLDPPLPATPNSPFAVRQPVPEPLTATLGALALTALVLSASRRRG